MAGSLYPRKTIEWGFLNDHLKQEGANEETGENLGVKTRGSDMLKSDLHCVTRAWSKWLTDKNAVLKGDIKPNRGRKKI